MSFGISYGRIEELALPYDPTQPQLKVQKRWRSVRSRIFGLIITLVFLAVIYVWQRAAFGPGLWVLYGVLGGVSIIWLGVNLLLWRQAKQELARMGTGIAVRIGRAGVQVRDTFAYWPSVIALKVVKGGVGRSERLRLEHAGGKADVPLDQLDVRPASLDTTARAYSAGRHGVDLSALDA